jgi:hypothetical protein
MPAFVLGLIAIVILLIAFRNWTPNKPAAAPEEEPRDALLMAKVPREWTPLLPGAPPGEETAPKEQTLGQLDKDSGLIITNPAAIEIQKQMVKHMDLRYLESSPAKDTPEAKQIQELLKARGIGREAVRSVTTLRGIISRHSS